MKTNTKTALVRNIGLSIIFAAAVQHAAAQGIIYGTPQQPIWYNTMGEGSDDINILGGATPDFTLISSQNYYGVAGIAPQGSNSIIANINPDPNGCRFFAALSAGDSIGSSLDPAYIWYNKNTDQNSQAIIGYGPLQAYFTTTFVGFNLYYDGASHYGWMRLVGVPAPFIAGQVTDWAYESTPNTPILAGVVPEPSTWALLATGAALMLCLRKTAPRSHSSTTWICG